jgi:TolB protein
MIKLTFLVVLISSQLFGQENEILFTKQVNNNDNIFLINMEGQLKQVTNHNRKDSSPMISPDGRLMVFTSERVGWWKIWLLDTEKNEFKQLTNSNSAEYSPSWSPDGKHIVFVSTRDGNDDIYTMNRDGENLKNISNKENSNTMPSWGLDNLIYYSSKIDGVYQIVRCKPDGSNEEIITNDSDNKLMPQLSNDLTKILYYGDKDGNLEIYTLNIKNKATLRLTNNPLMDMRPRWSTDNESIVFERGNKGNNHHIYIMSVKDKKVKQLTFKNYNYSPSFVPKGIRVLKD